MFAKTSAERETCSAGKFVAHQLAGRLFVVRIGVGVEEADGEGLDAGPVHEAANRLAHALAVQALDHRPVVPDPFADLAAKPPRDQRIRPREPQVEQVVALLEAHVEEVAEPRGHQHPGLRPPPLDDRVGDEGRAVGDRLDRGHRDVLAVEEGGRPVEHRDRRIGRRGELLVHRDAAALFVEQGEVGERAADVDAEPVGHGPGISFRRVESRRDRTRPTNGIAAPGGRAGWWRASAFQNNITAGEASGIVR